MPRADIEWQMARANVRSVVGDDLDAVAHRAGLTTAEALDLLAAAPRRLLAKTPSEAFTQTERTLP
ncbi:MULTISPECIES: hypothetical protein [unclassified Streptomyces]|uniref:hypothetical protein n=1 Tax=unclassified Streptomyces TaxID=2593676 RepID=UPI00096893F8|nr:hypothetical protein [Streptomyces sp. TSRI0281]OKI35031.1 hypothetical protein A6A29_16550 [Streptomyces sp. TSRI0281]